MPDLNCPMGTDHRRKIDETHDGVLKLLGQFAHLQERVDEHHKTLYGNGKPGLVSDMGFVRTARKVFWLFIGAAATLLTTAAGTGFVWLVLHMYGKR